MLDYLERHAGANTLSAAALNALTCHTTTSSPAPSDLDAAISRLANDPATPPHVADWLDALISTPSPNHN